MNYVRFIKSKTTKTRGFTLIETLVAISILMISIAGPMSFASQGLQASIYARDQITAFYLAQDAIEEIRNIRDTKAITIQNDSSDTDWLTPAIRNCMGTGISCTIDSTTDTLSTCSGTCPVLRQETSGSSPRYLYGYDSSWQDTHFTRTITITQVTADEIALSVVISWHSGALTKSFNARENMYNIYGGL